MFNALLNQFARFMEAPSPRRRFDEGKANDLARDSLNWILDKMASVYEPEQQNAVLWGGILAGIGRYARECGLPLNEELARNVATVATEALLKMMARQPSVEQARLNVECAVFAGIKKYCEAIG